MNKEMCLDTFLPTAVACDIYLIRRSAHPRGAFYFTGKQFPVSKFRTKADKNVSYLPSFRDFKISLLLQIQ